jgi:hypothetical protein
MKKLLVITFAICSLAAFAYAKPQAIVGGIKGKVEIKGLQGNWVPATEGMKLDLRSTISTGFDSTATLTIEKSTIVVKPLTRLSLDKLVEQSSGSVAASMSLRVGSVQAKVKAATPGTPQDFKVQSPYSTASVRGTYFGFGLGYLEVYDGSVLLIPGRPTRDIGPPEEGSQALSEGDASDSGFEGAADVGAADPNAAVLVRGNQRAGVFVKYSRDSGVFTPEVFQTGSSGGGPGGAAGKRGTPGLGTKTGAVTITVVTK